MLPLIIPGVTLAAAVAGMFCVQFGVNGYSTAERIWEQEYRAVRDGQTVMRTGLVLLAPAAWVFVALGAWISAVFFGVLWVILFRRHRRRLTRFKVRDLSHRVRPRQGYVHRAGGWVEDILFIRTGDGLVFRPISPDGEPVLFQFGDQLCTEPLGPGQRLALAGEPGGHFGIPGYHDEDSL